MRSVKCPARVVGMSTKHNTKHRRSLSHYKERLLARGLITTPRMSSHRLSDGKMGDAKR